MENYDLDFILNHITASEDYLKIDDNNMYFCLDAKPRLVELLNTMGELNMMQVVLCNHMAVIPLSVQICQIAAVPLSLALANKRAERIESMLVRWF